MKTSSIFFNYISMPALGCMLGLSFLAGCTPKPLVKYPTNAEILYSSAMDAGSKIIKKNPGAFEKNTVSLHNLDRASSAQSPVDNIVRDALIESIYATGRGLLERESSAFAAAARESGKLDSSVAATYVNSEDFDSFTDTISVVGKGPVAPVGLVLAYRITDAGIIYEQDSKKMSNLTRQAKTELFYELISAETGQVLGAGRVSGKISDVIETSERARLEKPERQTSPYPFEKRAH